MHVTQRHRRQFIAIRKQARREALMAKRRRRACVVPDACAGRREECRLVDDHELCLVLPFVCADLLLPMAAGSRRLKCRR